MHVLGWLIIGLIAGALARLVVPGRDPMGVVATIGLGLAGAVVGGLIGRALFHHNEVGLFGSFVGAVLVLLVWHRLVSSRRRGFSGLGRRVMS